MSSCLNCTLASLGTRRKGLFLDKFHFPTSTSWILSQKILQYGTNKYTGGNDSSGATADETMQNLRSNIPGARTSHQNIFLLKNNTRLGDFSKTW